MFVNSLLIIFVIYVGFPQVKMEKLQTNLATSIFTAINDNVSAKSNATITMTTTRKSKQSATTVQSSSLLPKTETHWIKDINGKETVTSTTAVIGDKRTIHVVITGTTVIQLPHDSLVLHAVVEGTPLQTNGYEYDWQLIDHPITYEGTETMRENALILTTLTAGSYKFKVTVSDTNAYGEGFVNVAVLEPSRTNSPPIAVISPSSQVITLPNDNTLLDASDSTDDDDIVRYSWEMQSKPLQASGNTMPADNNKPILQLRNLVPGLYEFKLTVTDSEGASSSTRASVTVKERVDNKPIANAGSNSLIHLPRTSIVLDGSASTDDYGVVSYRWTLCPDSEMQGVDMQGSMTNTLMVTNMVVGIYSFCLTVTDTSGQQDTAAVTVIVQPASNWPPVARAGRDIRIQMPTVGGASPSVQLDASNSTDDKRIERVAWKLKSGPKKTILFSHPHALITDVTGLTVPGVYVIMLTVEDEEGGASNDDVIINVYKVQPPVADAGPDITLHHLGEVALLDGSNSHDDHGIESYSWKRDPSSPSVGYIVEDQEKESKCLVVGLMEGTFTFHLTVTNIRGESSSDAVVVKVLPDPLLNYLVELHFNVPAASFTEATKNLLAKQIHLVLDFPDEEKIITRSVYYEHRTGDTVMLFYVALDEEDTHMPAVEVVSALRSKLKSGVPILDVDVKLVDTYVCSNDCSGRGRCYAGSKVCECDAFWMENFIRVYFGDGQRNCDWSILYVAVVIVIAAMILLLGCYITTCLCLRKRRYWPFDRNMDTRHKQISGVRFAGSSRSKGLLPRMRGITSSSDSETVYDKKQLINAQLKQVEFKNAWSSLDVEQNFKDNRLQVCEDESSDELA